MKMWRKKLSNFVREISSFISFLIVPCEGCGNFKDNFCSFYAVFRF